MKKQLQFLKNHKKKIIVAALILAVLIAFFAVKGNQSKYPSLSLAETTAIVKKDFINSVTESGKVRSERDSFVYAEKMLPVKEIKIKVGDVVKKGDIIAILDSSSIEQQIAVKNAAISTAGKNTAAQVKNAGEQLSRAVKNRKNGTNAQIAAAEAAVTSAYDAWQSAKKTYEDYKKSIEQGYNEQLISANSSKDNLNNTQSSASINYTYAKQKLDNLRSEYNEIKYQLSLKVDAYSKLVARKKSGEAVTDAEIAAADAEVKRYEAEVAQAKSAVLMAEQEVEQQGLSLDIANKNVKDSENQQKLFEKSREDMLSTYKNNADVMKRSYEAAVKNLKITKIAVDDEIAALRNNLSIAKNSGDNELNSVDLKYLMEDLEKTVIRAPISGTVTEMNMIKGQTPQNYIAKIETVSRIVADSSIKEFDLNEIKRGMDVEITSDALGSGRIFKGKLSVVNPTPQNAGQGLNSSSEVLYGTKVSFEDKSIKEIKPGMSVRIKYIIEKRENAYTVPSTSIYEKNGKSFVLVIDGDSGIKTVREIEVGISSENDFETVISSEELKKKLRVVNSPEAYSSGMQVNVVDTAVGE